MADKKYYWLRLPKDFFDKHYNKILRSKEDGKALILFYINLLTESIDHEAKLRYSDKDPYDIETLAEVTLIDEKIVIKAMPLFERLGLVKYLEDGTIFLPKGKEMIGCESSAAERMRDKREHERTILNNVKHSDIEIELKIEKEIEIDIKKKNSHFVPPTLEEVKNYCIERNNKVDIERFIDFYSSKGWMIGKNKMKDWKACIRTWEKDDKQKPQDKPKTTNKFNQYPQRERTPEDFKNFEKQLANKRL